MFKPAGIIVVLLVLSFTSISVASAEPANELTIRVHDYAHLPTALVALTEQRVREIYSSIGVSTRWIPSVDPTESAGKAIPRQAGELVLIILSPSMVRRKALPDEVLGTAAVAPESGASVAYILFDHVSRVAGASTLQIVNVLAPVIAHELGHLLLQIGSHSRGGLMRAFWSVRAFMGHNPQETAFTPAQGDDIRRAIRRRNGDEPNGGSN